MRIVLDTNLFISSLITSAVTPPGQLVDAWLDDRFDLASSETQIDEIKDVTGRPGIRTHLIPSDVGRLINQLRSNAIMVTPTPGIDACRDPDDNFLLGMAQAGTADYLVSGDKRHVLALENWQGTRIVTARTMADILKLG